MTDRSSLEIPSPVGKPGSSRPSLPNPNSCQGVAGVPAGDVLVLRGAADGLLRRDQVIAKLDLTRQPEIELFRS